MNNSQRLLGLVLLWVLGIMNIVSFVSLLFSSERMVLEHYLVIIPNTVLSASLPIFVTWRHKWSWSIAWTLVLLAAFAWVFSPPERIFGYPPQVPLTMMITQVVTFLGTWAGLKNSAPASTSVH